MCCLDIKTVPISSQVHFNVRTAVGSSDRGTVPVVRFLLSQATTQTERCTAVSKYAGKNPKSLHVCTSTAVRHVYEYHILVLRDHFRKEAESGFFIECERG